MEKTLLALKSVSLVRGTAQIIRNGCAAFESTGLYALIGPSGAGKTSVLMLLSGLVSPSSGAVEYEGAPLEGRDMPSYRGTVVLQFQESPLFPGTALDNLLIPFKLAQHRDAAPTDEGIQAAISRCALKGDILWQDMATLSGGEKQRLALARTLLLHPSVFLLDEPTSALDTPTEERIAALLEELSQTSLVICVTHSREIIRKAAGIVAVDRGSVRQYGDVGQDELDRLLEGS